MSNLKFYKCKNSGSVIAKLIDKKGTGSHCSGGGMEEIIPNVTEASTEKHLPIVNVENGLATIKVGSVLHPMEQEHFINFVAVETEAGFTITKLQPNTNPEAKIYVGNAKLIAVYEYCNLHGLWKTEL